MYKNGLKFPIFYIFLNEDLKIYSLEDLKIHKNVFFFDTDTSIANSILENINTNRGYEIYPYLLNSFLYLIQVPVQFRTEEVSSKFIKDKTIFISIIKSTRIDFKIIDDSLNEIAKVAVIDKKKFYNEILKLLYRNFASKLGEIINYSDSEASEMYNNFPEDYCKVNNYLEELQKYRPNIIKNYDLKKKYVHTFFASFNSSNFEEIEKKISQLEKLNPSKIKNTFYQIIKDSIIFNSDITTNKRNKLFKPIYNQIIHSLIQKSYSDSKEGKNALSNDVKKFLCNI